MCAQFWICRWVRLLQWDTRRWSIFIGGLPTTEQLLNIPDTHVHLYGKAPRKGRKVAHVTVRSQTAEAMVASVSALVRLAEHMDDFFSCESVVFKAVVSSPQFSATHFEVQLG